MHPQTFVDITLRVDVPDLSRTKARINVRQRTELRCQHMALRSSARTLHDLRVLLLGLKRDRHIYKDSHSFAQLRRILCGRIVALSRELRAQSIAGPSRRHTP